MIYYYWDIWKLDCVPSVDGLTNVVKHVHWYRRASNDVYQTSIDGWSTLNDPTASSFIDFYQLSKREVESWLESIVDVKKLDADLRQMLSSAELSQNQSIVYQNPPWIDTGKTISINTS